MSDGLARLEALRRGFTDDEVDAKRHRSLGREVLGAVSLAQLATVRAALGDGQCLEAALAFAEIDLGAWPIAEALWDRRLLDDLAADVRLTEALEFLKGEALLRWSRPLWPVDSDVRAWLDFERAYMLATDDKAFLDSRAMTRNDIARLQALWRRKLYSGELRAEAVAILSEPAGECPIITAEPASFPPSAEGDA